MATSLQLVVSGLAMLWPTARANAAKWLDAVELLLRATAGCPIIGGVCWEKLPCIEC